MSTPGSPVDSLFDTTWDEAPTQSRSGKDDKFPRCVDTDTEYDLSDVRTILCRRLLSRSDRALCRRLAQRDIPAKILAAHFKVATKTIRKIGKNDYSPKDDLSQDAKELPADWKTTLDLVSPILLAT